MGMKERERGILITTEIIPEQDQNYRETRHEDGREKTTEAKRRHQREECKEPIISNSEWAPELKNAEEWRGYIRYKEYPDIAKRLIEPQRREYQRLDNFLSLPNALLVATTKHSRQETKVLVMPWKFRQRILHQYHDAPESGRPSDKAIIERIRQR